MQIINYLKSQERAKIVAETDFVNLIWLGLVSPVDMNGTAPAEQVLRETKVSAQHSSVCYSLGDSSLHQETAPILEAFCNGARSEVALINSIQAWCHENTVMLPAFVKILMASAELFCFYAKIDVMCFQ